jgi:hypothetical protein
MKLPNLPNEVQQLVLSFCDFDVLRIFIEFNIQTTDEILINLMKIDMHDYTSKAKLILQLFARRDMKLYNDSIDYILTRLNDNEIGELVYQCICHKTNIAIDIISKLNILGYIDLIKSAFKRSPAGNYMNDTTWVRLITSLEIEKEISENSTFIYLANEGVNTGVKEIMDKTDFTLDPDGIRVNIYYYKIGDANARNILIDIINEGALRCDIFAKMIFNYATTLKDVNMMRLLVEKYRHFLN